ncbi:MAG: hypothetical protein M1830_001390 [Pleopsidium flavum]|nr:MAG: hypothetical protein M1830_001390 [Pleopsidium flavum]
MEKLILATKSFVREYMNQFDSSHDYQHILRVLSLANQIAARERSLHPDICYDAEVVTLASLLHDVGDKKYLKQDEVSGQMVERFLTLHGADAGLARRVQLIVTHMSYSTEIKDPAKVQEVLSEQPELAVVQDADRLDALGAIGVGRCFIFAGAKRQEDGMIGAITHFGEKLERLEDMMKTGTGKELAAVRTQRLKTFRSWWDEEAMITKHMSSE